MSRRKVSEAEERVLQHAMQDVRPLKHHAKAQKPAEAAKPREAPSLAALAKPGAPRSAVSKPPVTKPRAHAPVAVIDRRTEQKLKRGRMEIEAVLDLHGLKQQAAHSRLIGFISRSSAEGHKAVLVITGKGGGPRGGEGESFMPSDRRGVLKAQVPLWLEQPPLRELVRGTRAAGQRHGGAGALYVLLRKLKGS